MSPYGDGSVLMGSLGYLRFQGLRSFVRYSKEKNATFSIDDEIRTSYYKNSTRTPSFHLIGRCYLLLIEIDYDWFSILKHNITIGMHVTFTQLFRL